MKTFREIALICVGTVNNHLLFLHESNGQPTQWWVYILTKHPLKKKKGGGEQTRLRTKVVLKVWLELTKTKEFIVKGLAVYLYSAGTLLFQWHSSRTQNTRLVLLTTSIFCSLPIGFVTLWWITGICAVVLKSRSMKYYLCERQLN